MTLEKDTTLETSEQLSEESSGDPVDILDIPDSDFSEQEKDILRSIREPSEEDAVEEDEEDVSETSPEDAEEDLSEDEGDTSDEEESPSETSTDVSEDGTAETESEDTEEESEEAKESEEGEEPSEEVDYSAFYKNVMKPFKANGKMITPETEEDVVRLMQKGANYVKKMATIKPALKVLSTLEKNSVSEEDLNFLIDVKNKNPDAIKKLVKDSGIDFYNEYDPDTEVDYKPSNNLATEEEALFNQTVREIQNSPHFDTTKKVVTETWDKESRDMILKRPELLSGLHEEIEMERFDKVQSIVDKERSLGRLDGVSDIEAYMQVVSKMSEKEQVKEKPKTTAPKQKTATIRQPANKTDKNKAKPSPAKTKEAKVKYTDDEILDMSDEAFRELEKKKLY